MDYILNTSFISACELELKRNSGKGRWDEWCPDSKELSKEISWHCSKLMQALLNGDERKIKEYCCDLAVYCEKGYILAETFQPYDDGSPSDIEEEEEGGFDY